MTEQVLDADDAAWEDMANNAFSPYVGLFGTFGEIDSDNHVLDGTFTLAQVEMIVRQIKKRIAAGKKTE